LSGFRDIHVIDLDEVDVTNLNRQFLFRFVVAEEGSRKTELLTDWWENSAKDVGQSKALTAAAFINRRVPGARVTPHHCRIEKVEELLKDGDFYRNFQVVVCGLDSVAARRWMNNKCGGISLFLLFYFTRI
jgi:ubiquitin-activating enzyme E1 C